MFSGKEIVLLRSDISQNNSNIIKKFPWSEISIKKIFAILLQNKCFLMCNNKEHLLNFQDITLEDKTLSSKIILVVWKCPFCKATKSASDAPFPTTSSTLLLPILNKYLASTHRLVADLLASLTFGFTGRALSPLWLPAQADELTG